jgi:signal transduction histidine kinase
MSTETLIQRIGQLPQSGDIPSSTYVFMLSLIGGIGIATLAIHMLHLFSVAEGLLTIVFGSLIPLLLSLALLGTVAWLHVHRREDLIVSIGLWCVVSALVLIGVSVSSVVYQQANGVTMTRLPFVLANHATVGAVLGALMGLYDAQRGSRTSELRAERERAKRLTDRLTVLNRLLRHDIRNAVNVIRGNSELIRSGSTEVETLADTIDGKAAELLELGERARKIEQLFEGDADSAAVIDLAPILEAKLHKLANERPGVDVDVDVPMSAEVRSSPLIEDAIEELLENAIEHNDAESPLVSVRVAADSRATGGVQIRIADNGPGLPDSEVATLARGHETDLKHASGLGLWFVYWVVERSDGRLDFDDREPRGSVVTLTLPARREQ